MARFRRDGLLELGGDPRQLVMVKARGSADALSAAGDILACPHVGALLLEVGGEPKCLDLVASRRLVLAAEESGVTAMMLRAGASTEAQRRADPLAGGKRAVIADG